MTDEAYVKQLEAANEKLCQQLVVAQETIDYLGATWTEEMNDIETLYRFCIGTYCLAVIVNPSPNDFRCHVLKIDGNRSWGWSAVHQAGTLNLAKNICEFRLGVGKKRMESRPDDERQLINSNAHDWMTAEITHRR